jgi:phosphatidylinositol-3-phosphatase
MLRLVKGWRAGWLVVGVVLVAALGTLVTSPGGRPVAAQASAAPCGFLTGPPATFKHVIVLMDENQSYSAIIGNTSAAPNINAYANECGLRRSIGR